MEDTGGSLVSYANLYTEIESELVKERRDRANNDMERFEEMSALDSFLNMVGGAGDQEEENRGASPTETLEAQLTSSQDVMDGFKRMERCRMALDALDRAGWKRSFFQRKFHDSFMAACARAFFKLDPPGSFQRAYQRILEVNNWDNLSQEILISTPRRFGKTISVSLFSAALLFSCAGVELSIYSTCKRISQKLLRNVVKFLHLINTTLGTEPMPVLRANCEEIHIQGPEGPADVRVTNSYPSKVSREEDLKHGVLTRPGQAPSRSFSMRRTQPFLDPASSSSTRPPQDIPRPCASARAPRSTRRSPRAAPCAPPR